MLFVTHTHKRIETRQKRLKETEKAVKQSLLPGTMFHTIRMARYLRVT